MRDMSALNAPLKAPAGYGGANAPVTGNADPQDAMPRVEKATNSNGATGVVEASSEAHAVLKTAAAMVAAGLVLLWIFGGLVIKNANI